MMKMTKHLRISSQKLRKKFNQRVRSQRGKKFLNQSKLNPLLTRILVLKLLNFNNYWSQKKNKLEVSILFSTVKKIKLEVWLKKMNRWKSSCHYQTMRINLNKQFKLWMNNSLSNNLSIDFSQVKFLILSKSFGKLINKEMMLKPHLQILDLDKVLLLQMKEEPTSKSSEWNRSKSEICKKKLRCTKEKLLLSTNLADLNWLNSKMNSNKPC